MNDNSTMKTERSTTPHKNVNITNSVNLQHDVKCEVAIVPPTPPASDVTSLDISPVEGMPEGAKDNAPPLPLDIKLQSPDEPVTEAAEESQITTVRRKGQRSSAKLSPVSADSVSSVAASRGRRTLRKSTRLQENEDDTDDNEDELEGEASPDVKQRSKSSASMQASPKVVRRGKASSPRKRGRPPKTSPRNEKTTASSSPSKRNRRSTSRSRHNSNDTMTSPLTRRTFRNSGDVSTKSVPPVLPTNQLEEQCKAMFGDCSDSSQGKTNASGDIEQREAANDCSKVADVVKNIVDIVNEAAEPMEIAPDCGDTDDVPLLDSLIEQGSLDDSIETPEADANTTVEYSEEADQSDDPSFQSSIDVVKVILSGIFESVVQTSTDSELVSRLQPNDCHVTTDLSAQFQPKPRSRSYRTQRFKGPAQSQISPPGRNKKPSHSVFGHASEPELPSNSEEKKSAASKERRGSGVGRRRKSGTDQSKAESSASTTTTRRRRSESALPQPPTALPSDVDNTASSKTTPVKSTRGRKSESAKFSATLEPTIEQVEPQSQLPSNDNLPPVAGQPMETEVTHDPDVEAVDTSSLTYNLGDMVWAKVSGHPWWPAIIANEPNEEDPTAAGQFAKMAKGKTQYHVLYFGQGTERSWARENQFHPFKGKDEFEIWSKRMLEGCKKGKTERDKYKPIQGHKVEAWAKAVSDAEGMLKLTREDRITLMTHRLHLDSDVESDDEDRKMAETLGPDALEQYKQQRLREKEEDEKRKKKRESLLVKRRERMLEEQDEKRKLVFAELQTLKMKKENPEITDDEISEKVDADWADLPESMRQIYQPKVEQAVKSPKSAADIWKQVWTVQEDGEYTEQEIAHINETLECVAKGDVPIFELLDEGDDMDDDDEETEDQEEESVDERTEIYKLSTKGPKNKDILSNPACYVCLNSEEGDHLVCEGGCGKVFHLKCVKLESKPSKYVCDSCELGDHECFLCGKRKTEELGETKKCTYKTCVLYFHQPCLRKERFAQIDGEKMQCPQHGCVACLVDDSNSTNAYKGRLFKCLKCPVAYHVGDFCISAGSTELGGLNIICSRHFKPTRGRSYDQVYNVTWCIRCSKGGDLVCCEYCPASVHKECLKEEEDAPVGDEPFRCLSCSAGQRLRYGDIVWVKLGVYKWWPAEIRHPRNTPLNLLNKPHATGEFCVMFFGSRDYYWIHSGRVFQYLEVDDKWSKGKNMKGKLQQQYEQGLNEAKSACREVKQERLRIETEGDQPSKKPRQYKHIKVNNESVAAKAYRPTKEEREERMNVCKCNGDTSKCGPSDDCENVLLLQECNPQTCKAGNKCENQNFTQRNYPDTELRRCPGRGWGLFARQKITKGDFVNEYVGDLITRDEERLRLAQYHADNITNFYILTMDSNRAIDAGPKGNYSRFMNHCCDPNCETVKWLVNGDWRIGLFARKDILEGEELTFDYQLDCVQTVNGVEIKTVCHCGAENCSGEIGVKKKKDNFPKLPKKPKVKKKKRKPYFETENDCFICGDGGELLMCSRFRCPKVYHIECLVLDNNKIHGKWDCPWHFCDTCGKMPHKFCKLCSNSYCNKHIDSMSYVTRGRERVTNNPGGKNAPLHHKPDPGIETHRTETENIDIERNEE